MKFNSILKELSPIMSLYCISSFVEQIENKKNQTLHHALWFGCFLAAITLLLTYYFAPLSHLTQLILLNYVYLLKLNPNRIIDLLLFVIQIIPIYYLI